MGGPAGSGSTACLLDQVHVLLELAGYENPAVAVLASQCIALLGGSFPDPLAAALLTPNALVCLGSTPHAL